MKRTISEEIKYCRDNKLCCMCYNKEPTHYDIKNDEFLCADCNSNNEALGLMK